MDAAGNDPRAQDYTCGPRTYNTHTGIDIAVRDLKTAQSGVDVLAAADGRVVYDRSDVIDQIYQPGAHSSACGNGLVILHDSGWETRYCHLKQDSITMQKGDQVHAGQKIAEVGLSGATSWPHLAFSVLRNGKYYDPFSGRLAMEGCGLTPKPLWADSANHKYHAVSIFNLGFASQVPRQNSIDLGTFPKPTQLPTDIQNLYFWGYAFGTQKGDLVILEVKKPDGSTLIRERKILDKAESKSFFSVHFDNGRDNFDPGLYEGTITIERGVGDSKNTNKWKRLVEFAEVRNE